MQQALENTDKENDKAALANFDLQFPNLILLLSQAVESLGRDPALR